VIVTVGTLLYVTVSTADPVLPTASVAVIVITFFPGLSAMLFADQEAVPEQLPLDPWSLDQATEAIPARSVAVPARLMAGLVVV
jgi:hypothetical protein